MKRVRARQVTTPAAQSQLTFNEPAVAVRHVAVGPVISKILGSCVVPTECGMYTALMVVNTTAAALYVAIGGDTVAPPTSVADGIAIPANGVVFLSTEESTHVVASAVGLGVYVQKDSFALEEVL